MTTTAYWAPNQASIAQVETYTFSAPNAIGNTYIATLNGKSVTYTSISGDTAATAATGLTNLLNVSSGIGNEFLEITFANPSSGVMTATARVPGTPFANVPGTSLGLVLSTGGGLSNGISTAHTQANQSPSDINDSQNWLRVVNQLNPVGVRSLPQNGDDVVIYNSSTPLLWNLDQLASVQFNSYTRWQSFTGTIGLPENNPNGYIEWRATYFKFAGPQGSVPAGGLPVVLGFNSGKGSGPTRERYNFGSQPVTVQALEAGSPSDEYGIRILGVHTNNVIIASNGTSVGIATSPGEVSQLNSLTVESGATVGIGKGVTWTSTTGAVAATMTMYGGIANLNAAPPTLTMSAGAQANFDTDLLTWATITAQGGCNLTWMAGGIITSLVLSTGCTLDKSQDGRLLTITNSTIDGDTCIINDPDNCITFTNATTVKQQVTSGPFRFTGSRTVKVT